MVDLDKIDRSKYYARAEALMKAAGIKGVKLDYKAFGIRKNELVLINIVPHTRSDVKAEAMRKLKKLPDYTSVYDRWTRVKKGQEKQIYERGYFTLELDKEDR